MVYKIYAKNTDKIQNVGIYMECYFTGSDTQIPESLKEVFSGPYELCKTWLDIHCIDCKII